MGKSLHLKKKKKRKKKKAKSWEIVFVKDCVRFGIRSMIKTDGVDQFHQHPQSLHGPKPLPGLTFNSVMLGSFDLYAV